MKSAMSHQTQGKRVKLDTVGKSRVWISERVSLMFILWPFHSGWSSCFLRESTLPFKHCENWSCIWHAWWWWEIIEIYMEQTALYSNTTCMRKGQCVLSITKCKFLLSPRNFKCRTKAPTITDAFIFLLAYWDVPNSLCWWRSLHKAFPFRKSKQWHLTVSPLRSALLSWPWSTPGKRCTLGPIKSKQSNQLQK